VKKIIVLISLIASSGFAADSLMKPLNDLGCGVVSARVQSLSMFRDYENVGDAWASTLGLRLGYKSPELAGFSVGTVWDYAEPVSANDFSNNGKRLLSNGRINVLTEAWLKYNFSAVGLTNTFIKAGRQVVGGEVFRSDDFRQKPRSLEAVTLTTRDLSDMVLTVGHAWRLSNWIDNEDSWKFKNIDDVLGGATEGTRGVTWVETVYTGISDFELAVYDAYAHDIANIAGGRAKYTLSDTTALNGYYRHESDVGSGVDRSSDMFGASLQQKVGGVTLEPGYFSVRGDKLLFQETTTGINHPLGASMLIYGNQFNGGANTGYLKATTRIDNTVFYALYNYTAQDVDSSDRQELNFVLKQIFSDKFSIAFKFGAGYIDSKIGENTTATDSRLFVTYSF
jgi:hypothetical protein